MSTANGRGVGLHILSAETAHHCGAFFETIFVVNSGRENEIVGVFCEWLIQQGWAVQTQVAWVDVVAQRGEERLVGEAKGVTTSPGLDVDTMYGQLLRRMTDEPGTRYAVIVPEKVIPAASRVSESIRRRLNIDMYGVDVDDVVRRH